MRLDEVQRQIAVHGVLLDTNLLLLHLVSAFEPRYIGVKRLDTFTLDDAVLLGRLIDTAPRLYSTPHVLTEASNLMLQLLPLRLHRAAMLVFRRYIDLSIEVLDEASNLAARPDFYRLGLADAAVIAAARMECLVLTVDSQLAAALMASGYPAQNFNHLRML